MADELYEDFDEEYAEDDDDDEEFVEDDDDDEGFVEDDDDDEEFVEDDDDDEEFVEDDDDDEGFGEDDDDDEAFVEDVADLGELTRAQIIARRRRKARARRARRVRRARIRRRNRKRRLKSLQRRIRRIQRHKAQRRLRRQRGTSMLRIRGRRGRVVKLRLKTRLVTLKQFNALRAVVNRNAQISAKADKAQALALRKAVKVVSDQSAKGDKALAARLAKSRALMAKQHKMLEAKFKKDLAEQRERQLTDAALIAVSLPVFKAYGDIDNLFGRNNLYLAAMFGGLLFGDEVLRLSGWKGAAGVNKFWRWGAVVALPALAWLLLDERSTQFKSGVSSSIAADGSVTIEVVSKGDFTLSKQPLMLRPLASSATVGQLAVSYDDTKNTMTITNNGSAATEVMYLVDMRTVSKAS